MDSISRRTAIAAALLACWPHARAIVVEGRDFAERIALAGSDLQLNGVGLRAVAWLKGYVAALYLTRKATTAADVARVNGPKRLRLYILEEATTDHFTRSFNNGIRRNSTPEELARLAERMAQFSRTIDQIGKVKKGDTIDLDFIPGAGLRFTINGVEHGKPVPGEDLYAALLRIFIGTKPVDAEMKIGLLGGPIG